jgi:hypothetical protein
VTILCAEVRGFDLGVVPVGSTPLAPRSTLPGLAVGSSLRPLAPSVAAEVSDWKSPGYESVQEARRPAAFHSEGDEVRQADVLADQDP